MGLARHDYLYTYIVEYNKYLQRYNGLRLRLSLSVRDQLKVVIPVNLRLLGVSPKYGSETVKIFLKKLLVSG